MSINGFQIETQFLFIMLQFLRIIIFHLEDQNKISTHIFLPTAGDSAEGMGAAKEWVCAGPNLGLDTGANPSSGNRKAWLLSTDKHSTENANGSTVQEEGR